MMCAWLKWWDSNCFRFLIVFSSKLHTAILRCFDESSRQSSPNEINMDFDVINQPLVSEREKPVCTSAFIILLIFTSTSRGLTEPWTACMPVSSASALLKDYTGRTHLTHSTQWPMVITSGASSQAILHVCLCMWQGVFGRQAFITLPWTERLWPHHSSMTVEREEALTTVLNNSCCFAATWKLLCSVTWVNKTDDHQVLV